MADEQGLLVCGLYVDLLTWLAGQPRPRRVGADARRSIRPAGSAGGEPARLPELLELLERFPGPFRRLVGRAEVFVERAAETGRRWLQGVREAARVFC